MDAHAESNGQTVDHTPNGNGTHLSSDNGFVL
jgi:hypothetical protein